MLLKNLKQGAAWMSAAEKQAARRFILAIQKLFERAGVIETPLLALRVQELMIAAVLAHRLENRFFEAAIMESCAEDEAAALPPIEAKALAAAVDAAGKNRERIRKAMKELEDYCQKAGTPVDQGIADEMKPILEKTRDLPEGALQELPD
jgi:hypothetical protein